MINGKTKLLCLLGSPVEHSFSPAMHNASFQKNNINAKYMAFDIESKNLKAAVDGLKAMNFIGGNVTIPHKIEIINYLDIVDEKVKMIGACNTIVNRDGKLYGYNTDVDGFLESFKGFSYHLKNKKIAVLGTGGASKAIICGLLFENASQIDVFSRSQSQAVKICDFFERNELIPKTYDEIDNNFSYDVVINTTPVGMHPYEGKSVINVESVGHDETIFYDLIYNPLETEFLKQARLSGRRTINGLDMLIYQGIFALNYWYDNKVISWNREDVVNVLQENGII